MNLNSYACILVIERRLAFGRGPLINTWEPLWLSLVVTEIHISRCEFAYPAVRPSLGTSSGQTRWARHQLNAECDYAKRKWRRSEPSTPICSVNDTESPIDVSWLLVVLMVMVTSRRGQTTNSNRGDVGSGGWHVDDWSGHKILFAGRIEKFRSEYRFKSVSLLMLELRHLLQDNCLMESGLTRRNQIDFY